MAATAGDVEEDVGQAERRRPARSAVESRATGRVQIKATRSRVLAELLGRDAYHGYIEDGTTAMGN